MMKNRPNFRLITLIISAIFGIALSIPTFTGSKGAKINLGLDLQGGLYMLLEVETNKAVEARLKSILSSISYFSESKKIVAEGFKISGDRVEFEILDKDDLKSVDEYLSHIDGIEIKKSENDGVTTYVISLTPQEIESIKDFARTQAVDTIRNRLDQFGVAEPSVSKQGAKNIVVELPGIKTQEEEARARELISRSAHLELMRLDEDRMDRVDLITPQEASTFGSVIYPYVLNPNQKFILKSVPVLDGSMLLDAKVGFDKDNQAVINFTLNAQGAEIFGDFTAKNVGKRLAIVLDGKVYSAPVIRERIGGGRGQISGGFSIQEASDLAIALRSGALPAPIKLLEKRSVGPSLGEDSIKASFIALISGFALLIVFMWAYYGISGVIANVALVVNLFLIIAIMALFGATLTLPGMAGIILTVGIAVDANIIIIERIREFIRAGESIKKAIKSGYENAMRAILDANITTLFAAIILFAYGSGAIKGFALTISIGILASMLTAIIGTLGIYQLLEARIERSKRYNLWFGIRV